MQGAHEFETSLVYIQSSIPARSYIVKLSQKKSVSPLGSGGTHL